MKTLRTMPDFLREEERDATKFVKLNPEAKVWNLEMEKKVETTVIREIVIASAENRFFSFRDV